MLAAALTEDAKDNAISAAIKVDNKSSSFNSEHLFKVDNMIGI